jgi:TDG/mug DNA glycosylase family protein
MTVQTGFPPALVEEPHTLILGSMPGVKSLDEVQYYAHPRNRFWPIMEVLYGVDCTQAYQDRLDALNQKGVALWDVVHQCVRPGSLDSNIQSKSVIPNAIPELLTQHPSIRIVGFNGQASAKLFKRHFPSLLEDSHIEWVVLPSTSPAHASISFEEKTALWKAALLA